MTASLAITPFQSNLKTEGFIPENRSLPLQSGFSSAPIPLRYRAEEPLSSKNNLTVTNLTESFINNPYRSIKSNLKSPNKNFIPSAFTMKKSRKRKLAHRVQENIMEMVKLFGNRVGFLTITFKDDLKVWKKTDIASASRAFIKFRKIFINKYCEPAYIKVIEGTRKGRIHYHLVIVLKEDIFEKFNWNSYEYQKHFTIRNHKLHGIKYSSLISLMEKKAEVSGLGRLDLTPFKDPIKASIYVSKYLMKYQSLMLARGYRQITFSIKLSPTLPWGCNSKFGWVSASSRNFRRLISVWAQLKSYTEDNLPPSWIQSFKRWAGISTNQQKIYYEL